MLSSSPWPSPPLGEGRWRDRDNDLTTARRPARESARRLQVRSGGTRRTRGTTAHFVRLAAKIALPPRCRRGRRCCGPASGSHLAVVVDQALAKWPKGGET